MRQNFATTVRKSKKFNHFLQLGQLKEGHISFNSICVKMNLAHKSFISYDTHCPRGELIISKTVLSLDFEAWVNSSQQISMKDHSYFFHNLASEAHLEISEKTRSLLI